MNILFLSTFFPYPLDTGAAIRVYYLLRALARRHTVHLVSFMPQPESEELIPTLKDWGVETEVIRRSAFLQQPVKAVLGYLSLLPRDISASYSPEMMQRVAEVVDHVRFDAVIASFTRTAPYVLSIPKVRKILEEHNFVTGWMEEQYRSRHSLIWKIAKWIAWKKCQRYERWLFPQFDLCTMVSDRDRSAVEKNIPDCSGRVKVVPNGVDIDRNQLGLAQPQPDTLIFNGALSYFANADAMKFFLKEIMPLIQATQPNVSLKITGRTNGFDVTSLPLYKNVILTGYLDDVRTAVASSWACVVPLRNGGGTRLKILEAMALGTPVISTTKGAEGLEVTPEEDILIADEPENFATQTLRLLGDPSLRRLLTNNGRNLVESKYGWTQIGNLFCDLVEHTVEQPTKR